MAEKEVELKDVKTNDDQKDDANGTTSRESNASAASVPLLAEELEQNTPASSLASGSRDSGALVSERSGSGSATSEVTTNEVSSTPDNVGSVATSRERLGSGAASDELSDAFFGNGLNGSEGSSIGSIVRYCGCRMYLCILCALAVMLVFVLIALLLHNQADLARCQDFLNKCESTVSRSNLSMEAYKFRKEYTAPTSPPPGHLKPTVLPDNLDAATSKGYADSGSPVEQSIKDKVYVKNVESTKDKAPRLLSTETDKKLFKAFINSAGGLVDDSFEPSEKNKADSTDVNRRMRSLDQLTIEVNTEHSRNPDVLAELNAKLTLDLEEKERTIEFYKSLSISLLGDVGRARTEIQTLLAEKNKAVIELRHSKDLLKYKYTEEKREDLLCGNLMYILKNSSDEMKAGYDERIRALEQSLASVESSHLECKVSLLELKEKIPAEKPAESVYEMFNDSVPREKVSEKFLNLLDNLQALQRTQEEREQHVQNCINLLDITKAELGTKSKSEESLKTTVMLLKLRLRDGISFYKTLLEEVRLSKFNFALQKEDELHQERIRYSGIELELWKLKGLQVGEQEIHGDLERRTISHLSKTELVEKFLRQRKAFNFQLNVTNTERLNYLKSSADFLQKLTRANQSEETLLNELKQLRNFTIGVHTLLCEQTQNLTGCQEIENSFKYLTHERDNLMDLLSTPHERSDLRMAAHCVKKECSSMNLVLRDLSATKKEVREWTRSSQLQNKTVSWLRNEISDLRKRLRRSLDENRSLGDHLKSVQLGVMDSAINMSILFHSDEDALRKLVGEFHSAYKMKLELDKEYRSLELQNEALKIQNSEAESKNKIHESELLDLQLTLNRSSDRVMLLEGHNESLHMQLADVNSLLRYSENVIQTLKTQLRELKETDSNLYYENLLKASNNQKIALTGQVSILAEAVVNLENKLYSYDPNWKSFSAIKNLPPHPFGVTTERFLSGSDNSERYYPGEDHSDRYYPGSIRSESYTDSISSEALYHGDSSEAYHGSDNSEALYPGGDSSEDVY